MQYKLLFISCFASQILFAQLNQKKTFSIDDSLRGTINNSRDWWDVLKYDITIEPNIANKEIEGVVAITAKAISTYKQRKKLTLQLDLQQPLIVDTVLLNGNKVPFNRYHNIVTFTCGNSLFSDSVFIVKVYYHGTPKEAIKPPWDGGWVWAKDSLNRAFISVACQGLGASSWFACKDHQSDEPDNGATISIIVDDTLVAIANGKQIETIDSSSLSNNILLIKNKKIKYSWVVVNPINIYTIVPYIGKYVNFTDTFNGLKGVLPLRFYVLDYNLEKAQKQFAQVKQMLRAFEYWFGAYPFYEDGYKLVDAPYLGMENQSNIAYGNGYKNGYKGRDLSKSNWGLMWDFIIVHESGHEWFANSITTKDIADMWVHEGFTNYSEVLFTEYYYGKKAANEYCVGLRKNIANDVPIIGPYGVNKEGSGDMYWKACNMIHSIRNMLHNDSKFRAILLKMNVVFYHKTVTTQQIESFLIKETHLDLQPVFDQYLRTIQIPTFNYFIDNNKLFFKLSNCNNNLEMPIFIEEINKTLQTNCQWKWIKLSNKNKHTFNKMLIENRYLLNCIEQKKEAAIVDQK
jgi:aminopeptidase N